MTEAFNDAWINDQMLGRAKDEQIAAWKDGFDTAKKAMDAIFDDLLVKVAALNADVDYHSSYAVGYDRAIKDVLALLSGEADE